MAGDKMAGTRDDFEIYIHIPFCVRKCAYCDFLSGPASLEIQEKYVRALCREIETVSQTLAEERPVCSVFIGGGTPSILPEEFLEKILQKLKHAFLVAPDAEITIEANPGTLSEKKLLCYRKNGISRLSIGLQSPKDRELSILGRIHTWEDFKHTYSMARNTGFDNINIDLMFAIPDQTPDVWRENLWTVLTLMPEHVSAYSLIIEEGTPFAKSDLNLPDEDEEYTMYEDTGRILREAGYHQYEISNYALPGRECRHNKGYWTRKDYLGFGIGAASLYRGIRFRNTRNMQTYIETFSNGTGESISTGGLLRSELPSSDTTMPEKIRREIQMLTREDAMSEFMFLGLRMTEGVSREDFCLAFGQDIDDVYGTVLHKYMKLGLLEESEGRIRLTRPGIHVSNTIMADFL